MTDLQDTQPRVQVPQELERPQVIQTRELTKVFVGETAVDAITMDVPEGCVFGFIGPSAVNGII
jgi:ABC-type transporter Mla maintaining outer membrane lipid asymmetry ATPase subunit MlaF